MRILVLALPAVALVAACSGGSPIAPGYWETTVSMSVGRQELWSSRISRCIDAAEAAEPGAMMLSTSPLGHCQAQETHYTGGTLTMRAMCMGRGGAVAGDIGQNRVTLEGRYGDAQIDATFTAEPVHAPDAPPRTGRLTARRARDCPS